MSDPQFYLTIKHGTVQGQGGGSQGSSTSVGYPTAWAQGVAGTSKISFNGDYSVEVYNGLAEAKTVEIIVQYVGPYGNWVDTQTVKVPKQSRVKFTRDVP